MKNLIFTLLILTACSSFSSFSLSVTEDEGKKPEATLSFTVEPEKIPILEE